MEQVFQTPGEYVFRTGSALPAKESKSITIDGTLSAPFDWLKGRTADDENCHMRIYKDKGTLVLFIQDTDPYTTHVIAGSLKRDSILAMFQLNTEKRWTVQEFLKFIKTMRYYFPEKAEHTALVESLQKWSAEIQTVLKDHNDNQGNSNFQLERKVSGVPLKSKFKIEVPIFQGYNKHIFGVEIGLDPKAVAVDLYLISDELIELEIGQRESILQKELEKFNEQEYPFSKVVVS
jgi:hypothetical protein